MKRTQYQKTYTAKVTVSHYEAGSQSEFSWWLLLIFKSHSLVIQATALSQGQRPEWPYITQLLSIVLQSHLVTFSLVNTVSTDPLHYSKSVSGVIASLEQQQQPSVTLTHWFVLPVASQVGEITQTLYLFWLYVLLRWFNIGTYKKKRKRISVLIGAYFFFTFYWKHLLNCQWHKRNLIIVNFYDQEMALTTRTGHFCNARSSADIRTYVKQ